MVAETYRKKQTQKMKRLFTYYFQSLTVNSIILSLPSNHFKGLNVGQKRKWWQKIFKRCHYFIFCGLKFKHWKFRDWNFWDFGILNFGIVLCFRYFRMSIPTLVWMPGMKVNPDGTLQHDAAGHQHVGPHVLNLLYHETLVFF